MFDTKTQKKLKEEYRALLEDAWRGDDSMVEYCLKNTDLLVKLDNGIMVAINKPRIETSFCFGYRLSSSDTEEYDSALAKALHAMESEEHFMKANFKGLDDMIAHLSDRQHDLYLVNHYYNQTNNKLKSIKSFQWTCKPQDMTGYDLMSDRQREALIDAYNVERERFTKRLKSYLKRYGLSKVRAWTYWEDE